MAVTQQDIDNLTAAIASGERQVTIGSQSVTYRSIAELLQARDTLMRDLAAQEAAVDPTLRRTKSYSLVQAGRGYDE